jgi:2',3'-cyclic-nucleotide 2'-phosphodiesterase (5'-nucleotidase family)
MVKLKKYNVFLKLFVIFLTVAVLCSCNPKTYRLSSISAKQNLISEDLPQDQAMENFITPFRNHLNQDLSAVLAYSPETLDKTAGKWQSALGNLMADMCMEKANKFFQMRENKSIDLCLLNYGGLRAIMPQGDVTTRTAFEIMPFENNLIVLGLKGEQIREMISYIIKEKVAHPLAGMTFTVTKENTAKNILIQGIPLDDNKIYYVATNDYLAYGGDNMNFFLKNVEKYDLDYRLRNILIDYLKETDTIPVIKDIRIRQE